MRSAGWTCRRWDARSERSRHSGTAPRQSRHARSAADLLEGAHGRLLLGVSPAASPSRGPYRELGNQAFDLEILAVSGPVRCDHGGLRQGDPPRLNQLRAQPRQLSLGKLGEALEQLGRDDAVENAVAQELQALVVKRAVAAVRECPRQELGAGKTVSDMLLKTLPVHGSRRRAGRACD